MVAGEFLAEIVGVGAVVEDGGAGSDVGENVFAKRHEVAAGGYLAEFVGDDPRAAEVVGRGVICVALRSDLGRIFGDEFTGGINKNGRLLIGYLFDAFPFTNCLTSSFGD